MSYRLWKQKISYCHIGIISISFRRPFPDAKYHDNQIASTNYCTIPEDKSYVYTLYYALRSWTTGLGLKPIRKWFFIHRVRCWTVLILIVFFFKRLIAYDGRFDFSEYLMNIDHNIISIYCKAYAQIDRVFMGCIIGNARKSS